MVDVAKPLRVFVFMGGPSSEHEISLSSGKKVVDSLEGSERISPTSVVIGQDGSWTIDDLRLESIGEAIDLVREQADVVFIALHGQFGEDGTVQGLLEAAGVAYTGSDVLGSALAMDKLRTKLIYRARGLPTPELMSIFDGEFASNREQILTDVEMRLGLPCALKPLCAGSSVGVSFPKGRDQLEKDLTTLLEKESPILVEQYIKGRELTCGVLEIAAENKTIALPVTEIIPGEKYEFFDYEAKYKPGATAEITPAEIDDATAKRIQSLALEAHRWLGLRDFSRTDFMLDPSGEPTILETNTIPGLTPTSLLPQAAEVIGISFLDLVSILVDNAARRGG